MKEETEAKPSRSAEKRAARAMEDLARQLVRMNEGDVGNLALEGDLMEDIERIRTIRAHGAAKREIKHLAARLRRDPETAEKISDYLESLRSGHLQRTEEFHRIEGLRDRLCSPATSEQALRELEPLLPPEERTRLLKIVHSCLNSRDKKAFREIFRLLRRNLDTGA